MKKILMIYRVDKNDLNNQGLVNKMLAQKSAFEKAGFQTNTVIYENNKILLNDKILFVGADNERSIVFKYLFFPRIQNLLEISDYDLIWIRYGLSYPSFVKFLKRAKVLNPQILIFLDLPTFPYDDEWNGLWGKMVLCIDRLFRNRIKSYVNKIVTTANREIIWGIPVYYMSNGVDSVCFRLKNETKENQDIHLLAIGKWQFWHGLDRLIRGMAEYYKKKDHPLIILHVVGKGPFSARLSDLAKKLNLLEQIVFEGPKAGLALDKLVDRCHLGVGTLGIHRKGKLLNSSLKHREYCVRGLPFILSGRDDDFPDTLSFVQYYGADDSSINIETLIDFYKSLIQKDRRQEIRNYAIEHLSWQGKLQQLINSDLL